MRAELLWLKRGMNMKQLPPEVKQATQTLVNALKESQALRTYAESIAKMEADSSATALLDELQQVQTDLRVRQGNGTVTREDTVRLRQLQSAVQTHPTIATFLAADAEARGFLPEVNHIISDLIGIDFASLGRTQGCC